jgi:hypothetical protein
MQLRLLGYQQIVNNAGFKANLFFNLADIIFSVNCAEPTAPSSYRPILASTFGNCPETFHDCIVQRVMPYKHVRDGSGGTIMASASCPCSLRGEGGPPLFLRHSRFVIRSQ